MYWSDKMDKKLLIRFLNYRKKIYNWNIENSDYTENEIDCILGELDKLIHIIENKDIDSEILGYQKHLERK